jgi:hypothetical protein
MSVPRGHAGFLIVSGAGFLIVSGFFACLSAYAISRHRCGLRNVFAGMFDARGSALPPPPPTTIYNRWLFDFGFVLDLE